MESLTYLVSGAAIFGYDPIVLLDKTRISNNSNARDIPFFPIWLDPGSHYFELHRTSGSYFFNAKITGIEFNITPP